MTLDPKALVVDWTEDGQGIVLDTRTNPATVVGTHDLPDCAPLVDAAREARAKLRAWFGADPPSYVRALVEQIDAALGEGGEH